MTMHIHTCSACLNAGRGGDGAYTLWSSIKTWINWNKNRGLSYSMYMDSLVVRNSSDDGRMWTALPTMPLVNSKQTFFIGSHHMNEVPERRPGPPSSSAHTRRTVGQRHH